VFNKLTRSLLVRCKYQILECTV